MKLGGRHKADPSFNMSSMTDVIFLLLIFFIMTSGNVPEGMQLNLPKSGKQTPVKLQKVSVSINKDNELFLGKTSITKEALVGAINEKLSPKSEDKYKNVIMVAGDVSVPYGDIMEIVALCSQIENAVVSLQLDPNSK